MIETQKIIIKNSNNEPKEATVITFLENDINGKKYVLYTLDDSKEEDIEIYASIFKEDESGYELIPIETDTEWEAIQEAISKLAKEN